MSSVRTTARQADGRILTAFPGDDVVYIDLGAEDRLMLGLQFSVYSAEMGIPPNGQGKAQIEVVSIAPTSAECKIIRTTREDIVLVGGAHTNHIFELGRIKRLVTVVVSYRGDNQHIFFRGIAHGILDRR